MEQKGGLAHPRLRDQGEESEVRFNTVDQRCKGFAMRRTEIQEAWIGRNPEWLFPKAKEFQEHKYRCLLALNVRGQGWACHIADSMVVYVAAENPLSIPSGAVTIS